MVIFVTGASGYLGSQLVKKLSARYKCISLVRETSSLSKLQNIDTEIIYIDDNKALEYAFSCFRPDIVINTITLYGRNDESLSDLIEANILLPSRLYTLSNKYKCKLFLHTGTSLPSGISAYASTKNAFVDLVKFNHSSSMKFICFSLEHFYGPEDDKSKFTSYVINSCISNSELNLTIGTQKRDFIFINDVVNAYQVIIKNMFKLDDFEVIPLGSGNAPSVREFVEMVHELSRSKSRLKFGAIPMRSSELMYSCANTSRLNELGWMVYYPLEIGIIETLKPHYL